MSTNYPASGIPPWSILGDKDRESHSENTAKDLVGTKSGTGTFGVAFSSSWYLDSYSARARTILYFFALGYRGISLFA